MADSNEGEMTKLRTLRLRAVMSFARMLRVPVDVHGSYFMVPNAETVAALKEAKAMSAPHQPKYEGEMSYSGNLYNSPTPNREE